MNWRVVFAFLLFLRLPLDGQTNFWPSSPIQQLNANNPAYYGLNFATSDGKIWQFYRQSPSMSGTDALDSGHAAMVLAYTTDGGTTWTPYSGNSYCQSGDPPGCVFSDPNCCTHGNTLGNPGTAVDGSRFLCTITATPPGVAYGMRVPAAGVNPVTGTVLLSWQVFVAGTGLSAGGDRTGCLYTSRMTLSGGVWGVSVPIMQSVADNSTYLDNLDGCYGSTIQVPPGIVINGTTAGASGAIGLMCQDNWLGGAVGCTGSTCRPVGFWVIWSFDDGLTFATALPISTITNDPVPKYLVLNEDSIVYMGGTTLLGFGRANQTTTAGGPNCCNSLIRLYSTDMGTTWDLQSTGIQPIPLPSFCQGSVYIWEHVSPWLIKYTDGSMIVLLNERNYTTYNTGFNPQNCTMQNHMRLVNASAVEMEQNPTSFWVGKIQNLLDFPPEYYNSEAFGYASASLYGSQVMMQYNHGPGPTFYSSIFTTLLSPGAYSLTVNLNGTGTGLVTGRGIVCPTVCWNTYAPNASMTLTAASAANSYFVGWYGGACSGTAPCTSSLSGNTAVTAVFTRINAHHMQLGRQTNIGSVTWK